MNTRVDSNSPSIQTHLGILQDVIQRMAGNSAACKTWCITIVSALLVVIADKNQLNLVWLTMLPIIIFACLDTYYLSLEKRFRNTYNDFISKLHTGLLSTKDIYYVIPTGENKEYVRKALNSFSIWCFYLSLVAMVFVARFIII